MTPAPPLAAPRCTYRVFRFAGRPVVSLPATPMGRRTALRRFQPTTPRRRVFRAGVSMASAVGLDRWLAEQWDFPLPQAVESALARLLTRTLLDLGAAWDGICVIWPPQLDRGRLYVHAADSRGRPVAFVKIGLNEADRRQLGREVDVLRWLAGEMPSMFRVPDVIAVHDVAGMLAVVTEALPEGASSPTTTQAVFPVAAMMEYAGPTRAATPVETTSWWPAYRRGMRGTSSAFHTELTRRIHDGVRVVRAHGDLSAHNMAFVGRQLWLLDWEESTPDAPLLADRVGFALARIARPLASTPARWRTHLHRTAGYLLAKAERTDLMLALAFRHSCGFPDAAHVITNWDRSNGWGIA